MAGRRLLLLLAYCHVAAYLQAIVVQVADLILQRVQQLRWPSGEGVPLATDVIRLLHGSMESLTLDVKVQVSCLPEGLSMSLAGESQASHMADLLCMQKFAGCQHLDLF